MSSNYYFYSFFILAISISAYAVKLTEHSPIYFIYICIIPFSFLVLFSSNSIGKISSDVILSFILLSFVMIFHSQNLTNGASVNLIISLMGYIYLRLARFKICLKQYAKVVNAMVLFNLFFLGLDSVYRVMNPTHPSADKLDDYFGSSDKWFYLYKFNSLMFSDSNDTALVLIILLFTVLLLPRTYFYFSKNKIYYIILFLILLTFSRAAYLVTILGYFNYKMVLLSRVNKIILRSILIISVILSITIIYSILSSDDSFAVRLDIIASVWDLQSETAFSKLLIGVGPGQGEETLGIYTHIFYLTYTLELGILGLILVLSFFYSYMYRYGNIVLFPILIIGISFFLYLGTPFLFIPLALIANIHDLKNRYLVNLNLNY